MRARFVAEAAAFVIVALTATTTLHAQVGIAARVGTLGLGPEIAFAASSRVGLRGGIGFMPIEPKRTFSDIDYTLHPPSTVLNIGVDVYPGPTGLRLGGGLMLWQEYELLARQTGSTSVGGQTYSGTIDLNAAVTNANQIAPYVMVGFGRMTQRGVGMFVDFGVGFIGQADIELTGTCTLSSGSPCPGNFQSDLEEEEADAEADIGKYLELLPILQIGVRIGLGR